MEHLEYEVDDLGDPDNPLNPFHETADVVEELYEEGSAEDISDIDFEALGIDPAAPTSAKPGSEEKVLLLQARFAAGIPLWHEKDCLDHGPSEVIRRLLQRPQ